MKLLAKKQPFWLFLLMQVVFTGAFIHTIILGKPKPKATQAVAELTDNLVAGIDKLQELTGDDQQCHCSCFDKQSARDAYNKGSNRMQTHNARFSKTKSSVSRVSNLSAHQDSPSKSAKYQRTILINSNQLVNPLIQTNKVLQRMANKKKRQLARFKRSEK